MSEWSQNKKRVYNWTLYILGFQLMQFDQVNFIDTKPIFKVYLGGRKKNKLWRNRASWNEKAKEINGLVFSLFVNTVWNPTKNNLNWKETIALKTYIGNLVVSERTVPWHYQLQKGAEKEEREDKEGRECWERRESKVGRKVTGRRDKTERNGEEGARVNSQDEQESFSVVNGYHSFLHTNANQSSNMLLD